MVLSCCELQTWKQKAEDNVISEPHRKALQPSSEQPQLSPSQNYYVSMVFSRVLAHVGVLSRLHSDSPWVWLGLLLLVAVTDIFVM